MIKSTVAISTALALGVVAGLPAQGGVAPAPPSAVDSVGQPASAGWTGVWPTWKGVEYWMSSDLSDSVVGALESGSLGKVIGLIPGGALVAAVIERLGVSAIREANHGKTGTIILVPWIGFPSVRAQ